MNQEFVINQTKLIEDDQGYGVAIQNDEGWEVIASFKYPMDAVRYFSELVITLGTMPVNGE